MTLTSPLSAVPTDRLAAFESKLRKKITVTDAAIGFDSFAVRSPMLGQMPLYAFLSAACFVSESSISSIVPWLASFETGNDVDEHAAWAGVQTYSNPLVEQKCTDNELRGCPLPDPDRLGRILRRREKHMRLRLATAWHIPDLIGKLPNTPTADSTLAEKGRWAAFVLALFHPWRRFDTDVLQIAITKQPHPSASCLTVHVCRCLRMCSKCSRRPPVAFTG